MKIKHIEPIAVSLPLTKPVKMAGIAISRADNVLVRIESSDGVVGWGEAASAPTMTGETVDSMVAAIGYLTPVLLNRAAEDIAGASHAMNARMYGNTGAKAAIEIALHDLVGRATNRPVHALLGEQRRRRIPILYVLSTGEVDGDVREAKEKSAQGCVAYKIKVGMHAPEADAERTRQVLAALDRNHLACADANQGWNTDEAVTFVRALSETNLAFFEQPVRADDIAGMARVAAASRIAIGADEGIHSLDDIRRHHERKAARGVSLKTIKLGGLRGAVAAGALCQSLDFNINVSCKAGESSIASAAGVHLAAVLPSIDWGLSLGNQGLADDTATEPLAIEAGHVVVPDRPGLGIEVDEDRVRRYAREFAARKVA
jgi:L-alanine-DL-glutamate epimerase-like enolase superfamily enzyme